MKSFLLSVSALALATSLASAADLPARNLPARQAPLPVFTWTGFYVGAHVGGEWGRTSLRERGPCGCGDSFSATDGGALGGVQMGANYQMDAFVFGVRAEFAASGYDNRAVYPSSAPDYVAVRKRWEMSLLARAGFAVDRTLFYVTGGATVADFRYTYANIGYVVPISNETKTRTGWTIGAGVEYALSYQWSVGIEYRYTDFGRVTLFPAAFDSVVAERHHDVEHGVRLGVNYRF